MISLLYVDDEPDLLELGKIFLEQNGTFAVTTADSGPQALAFLKEQEFDAIVSDFQMPEMDGIALLHKIRSTSEIPFILFTGKGREEVVIDAINSGADFYIQKGGDTAAQFAELGHKILQAVSRQRAEQALHTRLNLIRQTSVASTRFIQLPADQIDEAITQLLWDIGTQTGADRCYIAQRNHVTGEIAWTHEWVSCGIPSNDRIAAIPVTLFSSIMNRIESREIVIIPSVAAMPDEPGDAGAQKAFLQERGIRSFLILPLMAGPEVIGLLGLDTVRKEMSWPEEDIDIFRIYSQIIAGALARKAADTAIRNSEELYRTVFESTGTAMMILNEDKTISVVNREFERISAYSRDEVVGKMPWTRFVSPDDVGRMKRYHELRRADQKSVPKNYEFGFRARDGDTISTYITVEMIPGTKKSVVSLIDISREKSAQQELAESEEMFRSLAESLAEGIYMIQKNRFIYVNPAFADMFGYPAEAILSLPGYTNLFVEEDRAQIVKSVSDRLAGLRKSDRYTSRGIRSDGTLFSVVIHGSKTNYQGKPAIIGTVTRP